ncbi:MAG: FHA domain-containing protein [Bacillota bacterium]
MIGRQPGVEISLTDPRVSRQHAWLEVIGEQILVTDLDSTNGTLVNEEPVKTKLVGPGARLEVGDTVLLLKGVVT